MDLTMSIAAMATQMSQANTMRSVNIAMLDKVMETQKVQTAELLEGMSTPTVIGQTGQLLDILA